MSSGQQRRGNRPRAAQLAGIQPRLLVPTSIVVADSTKIRVEYPQAIRIQGRPKWLVNDIEAVTGVLFSSTIVEVDFQVPVPASGWFQIPAWDEFARGLNGEWVTATGQTVNAPAPEPPPQFYITSMGRTLPDSTIICTFSSNQVNPALIPEIVVNGSLNAIAAVNSMSPNQININFSGTIPPGATVVFGLSATPYADDVGAFLAPFSWDLP